MSSARDERRQARARWPGGVYRLEDAPGDDLGAHTTPAERIAMMWPLACDAWAAAGLPIPAYERAHLPGRLWRPGERPPDDDAA